MKLTFLGQLCKVFWGFKFPPKILSIFYFPLRLEWFFEFPF